MQIYNYSDGKRTVLKGSHKLAILLWVSGVQPVSEDVYAAHKDVIFCPRPFSYSGPWEKPFVQASTAALAMCSCKNLQGPFQRLGLVEGFTFEGRS